MDKEHSVSWECPHCGVAHRPHAVRLPTPYGGMVVANCDIEEGGCDKDVVLSIIVRLDVRTLKIEEPETPPTPEPLKVDACIRCGRVVDLKDEPGVYMPLRGWYCKDCDDQVNDR